MKVILEYETHHYVEKYTYQKSIHCPDCGKLSVWASHEGDYYEGPTHLCTECNCDFTMPGNRKADGAHLGVINQIKNGKCAVPISKVGN